MAALPLIIDRLRAKGYEIVSVSDSSANPRRRDGAALLRERALRSSRWLIFAIFQWFRYVIAIVFVLGIVLVKRPCSRDGILAIIEKLRPHHAESAGSQPAVTVLIPAHNEESVIVQTVTSVLASDVSRYSVDRCGRRLRRIVPSNSCNPISRSTPRPDSSPGQSRQSVGVEQRALAMRNPNSS